MGSNSNMLGAGLSTSGGGVGKRGKIKFVCYFDIYLVEKCPNGSKYLRIQWILVNRDEDIFRICTG